MRLQILTEQGKRLQFNCSVTRQLYRSRLCFCLQARIILPSLDVSQIVQVSFHLDPYNPLRLQLEPSLCPTCRWLSLSVLCTPVLCHECMWLSPNKQTKSPNSNKNKQTNKTQQKKNLCSPNYNFNMEFRMEKNT